jgi:hypothetical protein
MPIRTNDCQRLADAVAAGDVTAEFGV